MVVHRLTGYTVIMVRKVRLMGNTNCIHAIRMPHTPTMVRMAGVSEIPKPRRYPLMTSYSRLKVWDSVTIISRI